MHWLHETAKGVHGTEKYEAPLSLNISCQGSIMNEYGQLILYNHHKPTNNFLIDPIL